MVGGCEVTASASGDGAEAATTVEGTAAESSGLKLMLPLEIFCRAGKTALRRSLSQENITSVITILECDTSVAISWL